MYLRAIESLERLKKLKAQLEFVPQQPGVYIHKNEKDEILYVGKAKNLKARLKSYFTSLDQHSIKTKALVEKICSFEIMVTENEYESLLLENNLIKHHLPPYNILLRDDKTYPYIKIDKKEPWPRVLLTRKRKKDGALYFGPYTIPGQIHQILNVINRFFPLVKCTPTVFKSVSRPCNYYDIKKCLGPCKLAVDKKEYNSHLENVIAILNGQSSETTKNLKREMMVASKELDFEKAALLRDQLKALTNLTKSQPVTLDLPIFMDVIGLHWNDDIAIFYVTSVRNGKLISGDCIVVKNVHAEPVENDTEKPIEHVCVSFLCQYYTKKEIPDLISFPQAEGILSENNLNNLNLYLNEKSAIALASRVSFAGTESFPSEAPMSFPRRRESIPKVFLEVNESALLKKIKDSFQVQKINEYKKPLDDLKLMCIKNAENKFHEQIKINESSSALLTDVQKLLHLKSLPLVVECYDISTFQGSQTVASQVVFKDGVPYKSGYRKYIIKDNLGNTDDFASMREVIRRRFKNTDNLPDLVIIDGGTPQIREVGWTLKSLGLDALPFVGLAKSRIKNEFHHTQATSSSERLVIPPRTESGELNPAAACETLVLNEGSPAYRLLTQLRDEAHRFAITFHRQKRDKHSLKSVLNELPGLGAKRRKQLLDACPDLTQIADLNLNELSQRTKIPLNVLLDLKEKLTAV